MPVELYVGDVYDSSMSLKPVMWDMRKPDTIAQLELYRAHTPCMLLELVRMSRKHMGKKVGVVHGHSR